MPRVWKPLPKEFPADGATVWVTPSNQYNPPFLATFELSTFQFTDVTSSAVMPWWAIARWKPFVPPPPVTLFLDNMTGAAGTAWGSSPPAIGPPVALFSGQPSFYDGAGHAYMAFAGNSANVFGAAPPSPDLTHKPVFQANNNLDTQLWYLLRYTDNTHHVKLKYTHALQLWELQEINGFATITLASGTFDLVSSGPAGLQWTIVATGTNVTISDPNAIMDGTYTTAIVAPGTFAFVYVIIATAANRSGFAAGCELDP